MNFKYYMLDRFNLLYEQILLENRKDSYIEQLNNKNINNSEQLADYLYSFDNPKKEKVALYWLLKNTIHLPKDQDKVDKAFNLIDKQHLNYQEFNSPEDIINRQDKSTLRINNQDQIFDPDNEPMFFNRKELGDGIVVYWVKDSKEGQLAVRKAIDVNWGYDKNPWCLAARDENGNLDKAWLLWETKYDAIPKRIAFKNGKLLAFFASNSQWEMKWWDKNDDEFIKIPETTIGDDIDFLLKYDYETQKTYAKNPNCSIEILEDLFKNCKTEFILSLIIKHPNCSKELLQKIINIITDKEMKKDAQNKLSKLEEF